MYLASFEHCTSRNQRTPFIHGPLHFNTHIIIFARVGTDTEEVRVPFAIWIYFNPTVSTRHSPVNIGERFHIGV